MPPFLNLPVLIARLLTWMNNEQPGVTVQNDRRTRLATAEDFMQTHDRRDVERSGHDGRVGGRTPGLRGKTQSHLAVQERGIRGGEIVGQNDAGGIQRINVGQLSPEEIMDDPPAHIEDIGGPLPQIRIFHLPQTLGVRVDHVLVDMFHTDFSQLQLFAHRRDDGAITRHQKVCLKNSCFLLPDGMS